jgi:hypothetical protein
MIIGAYLLASILVLAEVFFLRMDDGNLLFPLVLVSAIAGAVGRRTAMLQRSVPGRRKTFSCTAIFLFSLIIFYVLRAWIIYLRDDYTLIIALQVTNGVHAVRLGLLSVDIFLLTMALGVELANARMRPMFISRTLVDLVALPASEVLLQRRASTFRVLCFLLLALLGLSVVALLFKAGAVSGKWYELYLLNASYIAIGILYGGICYLWLMGRAKNGVIAILCCAIIGVAIYDCRAISYFRIFYLALPMMLVFGLGARMLSWTKLWVAFLLSVPLFGVLGGLRYLQNDEFVGELGRNAHDLITTQGTGMVLRSLGGDGDFTCIDLTASAIDHEQLFRPMGLSYLYPLVHFVPRQLWHSKPSGGILTDEASYLMVSIGSGPGSDLAQIPYTAGIVGDTYLEGGWPFLLFIPVFFGIFIWDLDRAIWLAGSTANGLGVPILAGNFLFITAFAVRAKPYQVVVLTIFLFIGLLIFAAVLKRLQSRMEMRPYSR